ncbi:hypothetical protein [Pseudodesulfovibrio pelocollis]|uniref:hypothetical protein n=1 Tax=Pseudodesulfovibrio pelocollis TaxID=3051432 RepID=UPI00255AB089|nr:hypothetical protein [Pseudodesulfovibrio sp. SB368]
MRRFALAACAALAALLLLTTAGHAHRVNLFAYVDGDTVVTESGYSRSSRVNHGTIEVYDAATGILLLTGTTDDQGRFAFPIPEPARGGAMALRLKLLAGEGHQTEWTIAAEELAATGQKTATPDSTPKSGPKSEPKPAPESAPAPDLAAPQSPLSDTAAQAQIEAQIDARIQTQVEATIRRELTPVKQMLAELSQAGPGMTEIVGGIGYIVGIFGILAFIKSRTRPKDRA